jgi:hypothetical protein
MKTKLITTIITVLAIPFAFSETKQDHANESKEEHAKHGDDHSKKGPNGGHVVESKAGFSLEITVDKERKARIVFLDKELKAAALAGQSVTCIAGERSAPTKLSFAKGKDSDANVLISDKPLPAGAHVAIVLMIKTAPDAKTATERFELHLH